MFWGQRDPSHRKQLWTTEVAATLHRQEEAYSALLSYSGGGRTSGFFTHSGQEHWRTERPLSCSQPRKVVLQTATAFRDSLDIRLGLSVLCLFFPRRPACQRCSLKSLRAYLPKGAAADRVFVFNILLFGPSKHFSVNKHCMPGRKLGVFERGRHARRRGRSCLALGSPRDYTQ